MSNLLVAKEYLSKGYSVCLCKDEEILLSSGKGIAFIAFLARDGKKFVGYSVADKIVGKAASHVYVLLGVREVYGSVMTKEGLDILTKNGIVATYGTLVEQIINRSGDGICPMEMAVKDLSESHKALEAVLNKIELLKKGKIE